MEPDLSGSEVLLCVTGGIACYKAADLASRLVRAGAGVSVAMTASACQFVAPLTFQTLTGRPVHTGMWDPAGGYDVEHVALTDRANLLVVAPATANIIGKIANGIADDLVSTLAMAATGACPILLAPAMNTRMWAAPALQHNLKILLSRSCLVVGPNDGRLACGTTGPGRMAEPDEILAAIVNALGK